MSDTDTALLAWIQANAGTKIEDLPDAEFNESKDSPLARMLAMDKWTYGVRQGIHMNGWWNITVAQLAKEVGIQV